VTGAAGFIGSNFVRMVSKGAFKGISSITILDKLTYAGLIENLNSVLHIQNFNFIEGSILDPIALTIPLSSILEHHFADAVVNIVYTFMLGVANVFR
jgi:dTDP-glucose 4,6-dehydratase